MQRLAISAEVVIGEDVEAGRDLSVGAYSVLGFDPTPARSRFHRRELHIVEDPIVRIGDGVSIGSHCVIEAGVTIEDGCYIDHGSFVGAGTVLHTHVMLRYGAQVHRRVVIGARSIIGGFVCNDVVMGEDCDFFGSCVHNYIGVKRGTREPAPQLGDRVFVGFNSVVVGDVYLPDDAVVRAGVVMKPEALPTGNPEPVQSPKSLTDGAVGGA